MKKKKKEHEEEEEEGSCHVSEGVWIVMLQL
jgi:hypothetical protein